MLDVVPGDVLVVNSVDYPIKSVSDYETARLVKTPSFRRMATITASTKRSPVIAGGKRGAPAGHLVGLRCTPLDPVDAEVRQRLTLDTPHELLGTFVADSGGYVYLVVEELKR